jgi:hypothetical protein
VREGLVVKVPEKVALVADGQGNPPEVVTGTVSLLNVTDELLLLHGSRPWSLLRRSSCRWDAPMVAVATTPPAGIFSWPVGPLAPRQNCHVPFAVICALKLIPKELPVQFVKVGVLMVAQTGTPEDVEPLGVLPVADDAVQVTVATPTVKDTLLDDAVKEVFCGEMVSADAKWAPKPMTAASAGAAR